MESDGNEGQMGPNEHPLHDEEIQLAHLELDLPTDYPVQIEAQVQRILASTASSAYNPPEDSMMGPPQYASAIEKPATSNPYGNMSYMGAKLGKIRGVYNTEQWMLPSAQQQTGAMLVLPTNISLYNDVISRWESITTNVVDSKIWTDKRTKVQFIENLLGEIEKKYFVQYQMMFPNQYDKLINSADEAQNVLSQIRRMFTLEDPASRSTAQQNQAYLDLERLVCHNTRDLNTYMNMYKELAAKTGRAFMNKELSNKFYKKMPPLIGEYLEKRFQEKHRGNTIGILPRIYHANQEMLEMCKQAALQRSAKDFQFCSQIPLPGVMHNPERRRFGLRKAQTYKGKPHKTHVRVIKKKFQNDRTRVRKCSALYVVKKGTLPGNAEIK
ncbi:uncharacterized protein LOC141818091 [Curcuma longa]|uniref:uncharacterized protein LOC141818091 n=1 Tax=Curcuma longa TaxID=136217 RepID=UPI003D9EFD42